MSVKFPENYIPGELCLITARFIFDEEIISNFKKYDVINEHKKLFITGKWIQPETWKEIEEILEFHKNRKISFQKEINNGSALKYGHYIVKNYSVKRSYIDLYKEINENNFKKYKDELRTFFEQFLSFNSILTKRNTPAYRYSISNQYSVLEKLKDNSYKLRLYYVSRNVIQEDIVISADVRAITKLTKLNLTKIPEDLIVENLDKYPELYLGYSLAKAQLVPPKRVSKPRKKLIKSETAAVVF